MLKAQAEKMWKAAKKKAAEAKKKAAEAKKAVEAKKEKVCENCGKPCTGQKKQCRKCGGQYYDPKTVDDKEKARRIEVLLGMERTPKGNVNRKNMMRAWTNVTDKRKVTNKSSGETNTSSGETKTQQKKRSPTTNTEMNTAMSSKREHEELTTSEEELFDELELEELEDLEDLGGGRKTKRKTRRKNKKKTKRRRKTRRKNKRKTKRRRKRKRKRKTRKK